jgi:threonine dehydrogenase-like Zn-dependent dehydrogenase
MKRAKILIAASALLLGAGSFIVANAHSAKHNLKKHFQAASAYYSPSTNVWVTLFSGGSGGGFNTELTTTSTPNQTAKFTTHGGTHALFASKSTSTPLYY